MDSERNGTPTGCATRHFTLLWLQQRSKIEGGGIWHRKLHAFWCRAVVMLGCSFRSFFLSAELYVPVSFDFHGARAALNYCLATIFG